jgi:hypothetical protein
MLRLSAVAAMTALTAIAQKTDVQFDREADFAKYKTYSWIASKRPAQPLNEKIIQRGVDEALGKLGFAKVADGAPADLNVAYHVAVEERTEVVGYDYGYYPGRWRRMSGGMVTYNEYKYQQGTLVVDLVDAGKHEMIWRGVATDTVPTNQGKAEKAMAKVAKKWFAKWPPK